MTTEKQKVWGKKLLLSLLTGLAMTTIPLTPVSASYGAGGGSAGGFKSVAIGESCTTTESGAVALGYGNVAHGQSAITLGIGNRARGTGSVSIGDANNRAQGDNDIYNSTIAIGRYNDAAGHQAIAMGMYAKALAANTLALGNTAVVSAINSMAIGTSSTANKANSIALGAFAVTKDAHTAASALTLTYGGRTYTYAGAANNANGTLSIGNAGKERQIQNVAAGNIANNSTDAINGSQLNAVVQGIKDSNIITNTRNGLSNNNTIGQNLDALNTALGSTNNGTYVKATNTVGQNINALDTQLKSNTDNITKNSNDIATNKDNITKNTTAITENKNNIIKNTTAITENKNNIIKNTTAITENKNNITKNTTAITENRNEIINTKNELHTTKTEITNIKNSISVGYDFGGDNTSSSIGVGKKINITGDGKNIKTTFVKDSNTGNATIKVALNENFNVASLKIDGKTYIDGNGINANNKIISNLKNGAISQSSKDAINGSQLYNALGDQSYNKVQTKGAIKDGMSATQAVGTINNNIGNVHNYASKKYVKNDASLTENISTLDQELYATNERIDNINTGFDTLMGEINTVGALSSAMAGLHPRFQDGNKGELAMALGTYGGKQALAAGGFYAPNEKVMFSLGMGFAAGGAKMANFGVNFALDRTKDRKKVPRDIVYTRKEVDSMIGKLIILVTKQRQELEALKKNK